MTVEYSNSVKSWINALRKDGTTYAGLYGAEDIDYK